jgi:hypothetical protein
MTRFWAGALGAVLSLIGIADAQAFVICGFHGLLVIKGQRVPKLVQRNLLKAERVRNLPLRGEERDARIEHHVCFDDPAAFAIAPNEREPDVRAPTLAVGGLHRGI